MKRATLSDVFAAVFLLAIVLVLVRPTSVAPTFLREFGSAMTGLVTFATTG